MNTESRFSDAPHFWAVSTFDRDSIETAYDFGFSYSYEAALRAARKVYNRVPYSHGKRFELYPLTYEGTEPALYSAVWSEVN